MTIEVVVVSHIAIWLLLGKYCYSGLMVVSFQVAGLSGLYPFLSAVCSLWWSLSNYHWIVIGIYVKYLYMGVSSNSKKWALKLSVRARWSCVMHWPYFHPTASNRSLDHPFILVNLNLGLDFQFGGAQESQIHLTHPNSQLILFLLASAPLYDWRKITFGRLIDQTYHHHALLIPHPCSQVGACHFWFWNVKPRSLHVVHPQIGSISHKIFGTKLMIHSVLIVSEFSQSTDSGGFLSITP